MAGFMNPLPAGSIKNMVVKYKDTDTVTITSGYCDVSKSYFELSEPVDYDLASIPTDPTTEDFVYIYVDYSESLISTLTFVDTTTEPVWSDALQGWYNDNDRCIGVVWCKNSEMMYFNVLGRADEIEMRYGDHKTIFNNTTDVTSTFLAIPNSEDYTPVNAVAARMFMANTSPAGHGSTVAVQSTESVSAVQNGLLGMVFYDIQHSQITDWIPLGISRTLMYCTNPYDIRTDLRFVGYKFAR